MNHVDKISILLVDDRIEQLRALESVLSAPDVEIVTVSSVQEALAGHSRHDVAFAALNARMRGMAGYEAAERMRADERYKKTPLIFITDAETGPPPLFKGYETAAVDFVFEPIEPLALKGKAGVYSELLRQKKELQRIRRRHEEARDQLTIAARSLEQANAEILKRQKSVVEEERLKVLLQMAGATAHEINQPLMTLLGNIELMRLNKDRKDKFEKNVDRVEEAGKRIADIVKQIQTIRHVETKQYYQDHTIINISQAINTLLIMPEDEDFKNIHGVLAGHSNMMTHRSDSIEQATKLLSERRFDLILVDSALSEGPGGNILTILQKWRVDIPVVVVLEREDETLASQALQMGAEDYIIKKNVNRQRLATIIESVMEKHRLKLEIKAAEEKIAELSNRDESTGLFNKSHFLEAVNVELERSRRYENNIAVLFVSLDRLSQIKETFGAEMADRVLSATAELIMLSIRKCDLACRYSEQEYAILLPNTPAERARLVAGRIRDAINSQSFEFGPSRFNTTASVGATALEKAEKETAEELLTMAAEARFEEAG